MKYVSKTAQKKIEELTIREGWLLVTRSGTIGRVTITPKEWDGWAASEHILRIIPREDSGCPSGYLCAFLSSLEGQAQLTSTIYGAVVDEITEDHAKSVLVPVPRTVEQQHEVAKIDRAVFESIRMKSAAVALADYSLDFVGTILGRIPSSELTEEEMRHAVEVEKRAAEWQASRRE